MREGELPAGWELLPIGEIVTRSQYGISEAASEQGTLPIVGMKDLVDGRVRTNSLVKVTLTKAEASRHLLRRGDLLLNRTNSPDLVGKVALWDHDLPATFASYLVRFRFDETRARPEFVNYLLNTANAQTQLRQLSTRGVSQANINPTVFQEHFELLLPPLPTQDFIIAAVRDWDRAIAAAEALVAAKRRAKRALMQRLLAPAIDPFAPLPADWRQVLVSALARVVGGSTPDTATASHWGGEVAWCTPTDITGLRSRYIGSTARSLTSAGLDSCSAEVLPIGSVVLCSRASVGACAINTIPMATNQGFQSLVPKRRADSLFLYYVVQACERRLLRIAAGSTFLEFPGRELAKLTIAAPDRIEREQIGRVLAAADDEIDLLARQANLLRHQKRGLMQKLLGGAWTVPERAAEAVAA